MDVNVSSADMFNYNFINNNLTNPIIFMCLFLIIASYFIYSLGGSNNSENNESSTNWIIQLVLFIIIVTIIYQILTNVFHFDINASFNNLFSNKPEIIIDVEDTDDRQSPDYIPEHIPVKQVFNIPGNTYDYDNAKAVCKAYGARLATYEEIEDAYKDGAEWCNYGWSDEQMALFPTQKKTYEDLQKKKGHEHDCGRIGVNGGYIDNPNIRFGVNCYGHKPKMTKDEEDLMMVTTPVKETVEDVKFEQLVDYWKSKLNDILVSPFNYKSWNKI